MAGALPTTPGPRAVRVGDATGTVVSLALSGKRFARLFGGHSWQVQVDYPPMTRAEFAPIMAFIASQQGEFGTFTVIPPHLATPLGLWSGTPVVNGAHAIGVTTIAIEGFPVSTADVVKAGDLVKFGHAKVYMAVADMSSDGAGQGNLVLNTPIITALADLDAIVHTNVPVSVSLDGPVQSYQAGRANLFQYSFNATETY